MSRKAKEYVRNDNNYAVAYYRYSSDSQRDVSIEQQKREAYEYAKNHGYTIIAEYEDRAKSGLSAERAGYQEMLAQIPKLKPSTLILYKMDRLGRELAELAMAENRLRKMGCYVETIAKPTIDPADPTAPLIRAIRMGMAESYSRTIASNIQRGVDDNARKCLFNGHKVYGYIVDESRHYAIDPATSPYVVKMFTDYANGKRLKVIADELNAMGLRTNRGYKWSHNSLRSILKNRAYTGEYHNGDYVIPDGMPRLISDELFEEVQKKFAENKRRGSQVNLPDDAPRYWLTGKLYCGHCESPMSGMYGTSLTGKRHYYYRCTGKGCDKKSVPKESIEAAVIYVLKQIIRDSGNVASLAIDSLEGI